MVLFNVSILIFTGLTYLYEQQERDYWEVQGGFQSLFLLD